VFCRAFAAGEKIAASVFSMRRCVAKCAEKPLFLEEFLTELTPIAGNWQAIWPITCQGVCALMPKTSRHGQID
jgi:hypothetical protein